LRPTAQSTSVPKIVLELLKVRHYGTRLRQSCIRFKFRGIVISFDTIVARYGTSVSSLV
jgi:hypothetical protein